MLIPRGLSHVIRKVYHTTKSVDLNASTAADIKRINQENKLMFGKLLETRGARRKRLAKCSEILATEPLVASGLKKIIKKKSSVIAVEVCPPDTKTKKSSSKQSKTLLEGVSGEKTNDDKGNEGNSKSPMKVASVGKTNGEKGNKGNSVQLSTESKTESPSTAISTNTHLRRTPPTPDGKEDKNNNTPGVTLMDTETSLFPPENGEKSDIQVSQDTELIIGRSITKSSSMYKYPSVTRILSLTMSDASKSALFRWRSKLIAEMGEEKFQEFHAKQLHLGSSFHSSLQGYLQMTPRDESLLDSELEGCWKSLEKVLPRISTVKLLESHVVHEELKYRGVIDCIAVYRDIPYLIEWKKSTKLKDNLAMTYDAPLQLSAYIGALNYDSSYPFKISQGLVAVAYSDGSPANVFPLPATELKLYWKMWMERYKKYTDMVEIDPGSK